jgi:hypothetical protein
MSDHHINVALLIVAAVAALPEFGIFWMMWQEHAGKHVPVASGMTSNPTVKTDRRLLAMGFMSFGPLLAILVVFLIARDLHSQRAVDQVIASPPSSASTPVQAHNEEVNDLKTRLSVLTDRQNSINATVDEIEKRDFPKEIANAATELQDATKTNQEAQAAFEARRKAGEPYMASAMKANETRNAAAAAKIRIDTLSRQLKEKLESLRAAKR